MQHSKGFGSIVPFRQVVWLPSGYPLGMLKENYLQLDNKFPLRYQSEIAGTKVRVKLGRILNLVYVSMQCIIFDRFLKKVFLV